MGLCWICGRYDCEDECQKRNGSYGISTRYTGMTSLPIKVGLAQMERSYWSPSVSPTVGLPITNPAKGVMYDSREPVEITGTGVPPSITNT